MEDLYGKFMPRYAAACTNFLQLYSPRPSNDLDRVRTLDLIIRNLLHRAPAVPY
jgi:hypothetical protein